jgi:NADP-dependent 3-hydroxy acid dehydrogenase YdfG
VRGFPGDLDTPLLNQRPQPPDAAARAKMMQPEDVATYALLCIRLPANVVIEELLMRPR